MDVALYGCNHNFRPRRRRAFWHVRLEHGDSALHDARALYDLRKEHFAFAEKFPHFAHGRHQRLFNDFERIAELPVEVHRDFLRFVLFALNKNSHEPFVPRQRIPIRMFAVLCRVALVLARYFKQSFRRLRVRIEYDVLNGLSKFRVDFIVRGEHSRVYYSHVEPRIARVV